jgi:predicted signal transduction protein with EAL and GGDEF domain
VVDRASKWRGWQQLDGRDDLVTSTRLGAEASLANRMFPKVRSWFALGAPLELLSPLSVARVVLILGLLEPMVLLAARTRGRVPIAAVGVAILAALLVLNRVKELRPRGTLLVVAASMAVAPILLAATHDSWSSGLAALMLVPAALFGGLFLGARTMLIAEAAVAVAIGAVVVSDTGAAHAVGWGTAVFLSTTAASLTVGLVAYAARHHSTIDPDTGLVNGYGLTVELADWQRAGRPFVVATLVLRGLGEAREALGYRVGSELIRRAVEDIGQVAPPQSRIARVDGDELVVAMQLECAADLEDKNVDAAAGDEAILLATKLCDAMRAARYVTGGVEVSLRAHVGLAVTPFDGEDITELIRRSSLAARVAVAAGRSEARWQGNDGTLTGADLRLLADLRLAPDRGELWVAYQPQIDAATGDVTSVEALLRWDRPGHGPVSPATFIPLAERIGMVDRLTDWVLNEALDAQLRWRAADVRLSSSVNFSALSLSDPELSDRILDALRSRGLPPDALVIEVTETAAVDVTQSVDRLRALHDLGIRISIDDFGTGYTSLSVLPHLPIDELKVDQRFVRASVTSPADRAIVESVHELAHRLGLTSVAEGVETDEIRQLVIAAGFDLLQGFYFSRPLSEHDLLDYVARSRSDGLADQRGGRQRIVGLEEA